MNEKRFDPLSRIADKMNGTPDNRGADGKLDDAPAIREGLNILEIKGPDLIQYFIAKGVKDKKSEDKEIRRY